MKLYNICYCQNTELFESLKKNTELGSDGLYYHSSGDETFTVYLLWASELESFLSLHSVDEILRIVYVGIWKLHISSHLTSGDILFPNTFLSKKTGEALYVDYAVWEWFDLEKFILHLDGVCTSEFSEISEEYDGDIEEQEVYDFLQLTHKLGLWEKSVVILGTEVSAEHFERISAIVDMVCSD